MSASIKSTPDPKDRPYTSPFACFQNVQTWHIYLIALKHLKNSLHPSMSSKLGDFNIVLVHIRRKIFAMRISWIFIALDKSPRLGKLSLTAWISSAVCTFHFHNSIWFHFQWGLSHLLLNGFTSCHFHHDVLGEHCWSEKVVARHLAANYSTQIYL